MRPFHSPSQLSYLRILPAEPRQEFSPEPFDIAVEASPMDATNHEENKPYVLSLAASLCCNQNKGATLSKLQRLRLSFQSVLP